LSHGRENVEVLQLESSPDKFRKIHSQPISTLI
jgi:hypothetical protein